MKRNMDAIRMLLIEVERYPNWPAGECLIPEDADTRYHLHLLIQAGLIEGKEHHVLGGPPRFLIDGLTWNGQEFLALASDKGRWERLKSMVPERLATLPFDVITRLLAMLAEKSIEGLLKSS